MATVTFHFGTDMRAFKGYDFPTQSSSGGNGSEGATVWRWDFSSGFTEIVTGTHMGTPSGYFPSTGTVTGWELDFNSTDPVRHTYVLWTFAGLSLAASDFSNAIQSDGPTLAAAMPSWLSGNDTITGSYYEDDYLLGYDGNDTLSGSNGNDRLDGGNGNDLLKGGPDPDVMIGGAGNDTFIVNNPGDVVRENPGEGIDQVRSSEHYYKLPDNVENLTMFGGSDGTGNAEANVIKGNNGRNTLRGGAGDDVLAGGLGNDTLDGGRGADTFLFNSALDASTNHDHIVGFSVGEDTIALSTNIFSQLTTLGTLSEANFFSGTSAHDADDRIIYDSTTGNIYYDADGDGAVEAVLFAHVSAGLALTNADFNIVG